jgi:hypothetical protein
VSHRQLGQYENFPETVHAADQFAHENTAVTALQRIIIEALHRINKEALSLTDVTLFPSQECRVSFEIGVAEGVTFSYVDSREAENLEKIISERELPLLDFLCVVRYHVVKQGKLAALKFDYYLVRFKFQGETLELNVFHERGPRRVSPKELLDFLVKNVNQQLRQNPLRSLTTKEAESL